MSGYVIFGDAAGVAVVTVYMVRELRKPRHQVLDFVETELETVQDSECDIEATRTACRGVTGGIEFDARIAPVFLIACRARAKAHKEKGVRRYGIWTLHLHCASMVWSRLGKSRCAQVVEVFAWLGDSGG